MQNSIALSLFGGLLSTAFLGAPAVAQSFEIETQETRYAGQAIDIVVSGLPPESEVELHARRVVKNHYAPGAPTQIYGASARFPVGADGRVDVSESAALGGSYKGVDPNGLFWSMRPVSDANVAADPGVTLEAIVDGETVAATEFDLLQGPHDYTVQAVPSLPGSYFAAHPGAGEHPVIIIVGGADTLELHRETLMPQLVAAGYSVFYFATYEIIFGASKPSVDTLPTRYVNIPVDRLQKVRDWLLDQPGIDATRIGLYGHSRNAAYVLLAATRFGWVDAVAAIAPSDVIWEGWGDGVKLGTTSSYSWDNTPLAYVPYSENWFRETAKFSRGERGRLRTPMDEGRWDNPQSVVEARIPIEHYTGAVLVAGGEQDDLWSAGQMAQNIAERRAEAGLETELIVFPDAGHDLMGDGQNPIVLLYQTDAARPVLAKAQTRTWQSTLEFFDTTLQNGAHR